MSSTLIVVLSNKLHLCIADKCPPDGINFDGALLQDLTGTDMVAFYDWFRTTGGRVVGVRFTLMPEFQNREGGIFGHDLQRDYLRVSSCSNVIEVHFAPKQSYSKNASCDQDFGNCRLYGDDTTLFAMTADLACIDAHVLSGDSTLAVTWARVVEAGSIYSLSSALAAGP